MRPRKVRAFSTRQPSLPQRLSAATAWARRFAEGSASKHSRSWQRWYSDAGNKEAFATGRGLRQALKRPDIRLALISSKDGSTFELNWKTTLFL
jgi:ferric-dicitrate binding protein FerR (iron transport regulator)